jgi:hypothetical protein
MMGSMPRGRVADLHRTAGNAVLHDGPEPRRPADREAAHVVRRPVTVRVRQSWVGLATAHLDGPVEVRVLFAVGNPVHVRVARRRRQPATDLAGHAVHVRHARDERPSLPRGHRRRADPRVARLGPVCDPVHVRVRVERIGHQSTLFFVREPIGVRVDSGRTSRGRPVGGHVYGGVRRARVRPRVRRRAGVRRRRGVRRGARVRARVGLDRGVHARHGVGAAVEEHGIGLRGAAPDRSDARAGEPSGGSSKQCRSHQGGSSVKVIPVISREGPRPSRSLKPIVPDSPSPRRVHL